MGVGLGCVCEVGWAVVCDCVRIRACGGEKVKEDGDCVSRRKRTTSGGGMAVRVLVCVD